MSDRIIAVRLTAFIHSHNFEPVIVTQGLLGGLLDYDLSFVPAQRGQSPDYVGWGQVCAVDSRPKGKPLTNHNIVACRGILFCPVQKAVKPARNLTNANQLH